MYSYKYKIKSNEKKERLVKNDKVKEIKFPFLFDRF